MNIPKKLLILTLFTAFSFNALAIESTKAAAENIQAPVLPNNFFSKYAKPVCKRAVLYGAFIAYWSYCSPNDKGDKTYATDDKGNFQLDTNNKKIQIDAGWKPQAWKKYVDYVVAGVVLYDPLKEDYKLLKSYIEPKWNAFFAKLDEIFGTETPDKQTA